MIGTAMAGPIIIDGTDSADHGSAGTGGWLYMQKALENLAAAVTPSAAKVVTVIGTASGAGQAYNAINSAFTNSSLVGAGWTINYVDTVANINSFMPTLSTTTTGILYFATSGNVFGDMDNGELTALNAFSANINTFVSGAGNPSQGGALFAQSELNPGAFGWLSALIPGIVYTDFGGGGIGNPLALTAAGNAAFPGLNNADLSAGPWHGAFSGNLGGLSVLATGSDNAGAQVNVIIGGGAGTVIQRAPEPDSLALLGLGLAAAFAVRRRKTN